MTTGRINQVTALCLGPVAEATRSLATLCRSNGVFGVLVSDALTPGTRGQSNGFLSSPSDRFPGLPAIQKVWLPRGTPTSRRQTHHASQLVTDPPKRSLAEAILADRSG